VLHCALHWQPRVRSKVSRHGDHRSLPMLSAEACYRLAGTMRASRGHGYTYYRSITRVHLQLSPARPVSRSVCQICVRLPCTVLIVCCHLRRGLLTIRTLVAKLTGIVFAIGAGVIAGKEGPFVHGGGIVGGGIGGMGSMCALSSASPRSQP